MQGVVELLADHAVCREGETLGAHQAAVLRIFDVKMAAFRMRLLACWHADGALLAYADSCQRPGACACTDMTPTRSVRAPSYHQLWSSVCMCLRMWRLLQVGRW